MGYGEGRVHWATHAPSANTAAVVTLAATPNHRHKVWQIDVSYVASNTSTGQALTVTVGGTLIYQLDFGTLDATGDVFTTTLSFIEGLYDDLTTGVNAAMVISAVIPTAATAKINVCHSVIVQQ